MYSGGFKGDVYPRAHIQSQSPKGMFRNVNPEGLPCINHQVYPSPLVNHLGNGPFVSIPGTGCERLLGDDNIIRVYGDVIVGRGGELLGDPNADLARVEIRASTEAFMVPPNRLCMVEGTNRPPKKGKT